ncbi:MAG: lasso peptide biosynthesis protein [Desulfobacterales bacterium]|nr:lasso peptide biosynthesis protein [Desulfobacterales bacterium]
MIKLFFLICITSLLLSCAASKRVFIPSIEGDCVDRAIILRQDLRADGYDAQIVLGTFKDEGEVLGHAWVKYRRDKTNKWIYIYNY